MTAATTMMGYSMSKTITAAAVLRLVQEQKVDLDVPVPDYIGMLPYKAGITARQLLSHTSGSAQSDSPAVGASGNTSSAVR